MRKFGYIIFPLLIFFTFTNCEENNDKQAKDQKQVDEIYIASWNMENLFDTVDDPNKNDEEFTPNGRKEWTQDKLDLKLANQAKVILELNEGKGPDILGVQEVEHEALLKMLIEGHLKNRNYKTAYAESPDNRGIDNGLIYDADIFSLNETNTYIVTLSDNWPTRLVFEAVLEHRGKTLHVYVNHWPSRSRGQMESEPNRIAAAETLRKRVDEILAKNPDASIVALGDFNDEPHNQSLAQVLKAYEFDCEKFLPSGEGLYNLSYQLHNDSLGSYMYKQSWNMLDQIIVSKEMIEQEGFVYKCGSFEILKPEYMITRGGYYDGAATPTFGGSNYLKGYSDHYPVGAVFSVN